MVKSVPPEMDEKLKKLWKDFLFFWAMEDSAQASDRAREIARWIEKDPSSVDQSAAWIEQWKKLLVDNPSDGVPCQDALIFLGAALLKAKPSLELMISKSGSSSGGDLKVNAPGRLNEASIVKQATQNYRIGKVWGGFFASHHNNRESVHDLFDPWFHYCFSPRSSAKDLSFISGSLAGIASRFDTSEDYSEEFLIVISNWLRFLLDHHVDAFSVQQSMGEFMSREMTEDLASLGRKSDKGPGKSIEPLLKICLQNKFPIQKSLIKNLFRAKDVKAYSTLGPWWAGCFVY